MNKYDKKESTVAHLTRNKKPDCVTALVREFESALTLGLTFRQANYYAEAHHYLADHAPDAGLPYLGIPHTDDAVLAHIEAAPDAETQAIGIYFRQWYGLLRTWDVPVPLAYTVALAAATEEYEDDNDLDEAYVLGEIEKTPAEETKDLILRKFYVQRNHGNSVRASLRTALEEAEAEIERQQYVNRIFSSYGRDGGYLN